MAITAAPYHCLPETLTRNAPDRRYGLAIHCVEAAMGAIARRRRISLQAGDESRRDDEYLDRVPSFAEGVREIDWQSGESRLSANRRSHRRSRPTRSGTGMVAVQTKFSGRVRSPLKDGGLLDANRHPAVRFRGATVRGSEIATLKRHFWHRPILCGFSRVQGLARRLHIVRVAANRDGVSPPLPKSVPVRGSTARQAVPPRRAVPFRTGDSSTSTSTSTSVTVSRLGGSARGRWRAGGR